MVGGENPEKEASTAGPRRDTMTILHILALGQVGGLFRVVEALAIGQRRQGHRVHVAAVIDPDAFDHPMLRSLREAGVVVAPLALPTRGYLREREKIAELCRQIRPHVVHTHGYRSDVVDGTLARRLGFPVVTTVHGFTGGDWKNRIYEWMQRRVYRRFDAVVAVSRLLGEELAGDGIPGDRIHVLPNAWGETSYPLDRGEARAQIGVPGGTFHIGWVGRVSREKGPDVLVDAVSHLTDLPCKVSILGDGQERTRLEMTAAERGLSDRIVWHGIVPDAGRYFPAFDVFVLSSRTEGTPIVLFEAMAAGVPIVATRVGGVPDVVSPAEALLVEPEDPAALAVAVRAIHDDPDAAAKRASAARERLSREFGYEPWLDRYSELYRRIRRNHREARR